MKITVAYVKRGQFAVARNAVLNGGPFADFEANIVELRELGQLLLRIADHAQESRIGRAFSHDSAVFSSDVEKTQ
jgi:hypothetical protein